MNSLTSPISTLLSREQLAQQLGVSPRTVALWDAKGLLPRIKISGILRYDPVDVLEWIKRCQPKAQGFK